MPASNVLPFPSAVPATPFVVHRPQPVTRTFSEAGRFAAVTAAERLLKARGFSIGTMEGVMPRGLRFDDTRIAKWTHLRPAERQFLHGKLTGDMINGPVTVEIFGTAPADALAAFARES